MVNLRSRLVQIKSMIDAKQYFAINRARQFGKTTTLVALAEYLKFESNREGQLHVGSVPPGRPINMIMRYFSWISRI